MPDITKILSIYVWHYNINIVVDANVLFSALIKDGLSYALLFSEKFQLFAPEYIFTELEKHKEEILEKTERTTDEFFRLIAIVKRRVNVIALEELVPYIQEAENITPDPDDMIYFALALKLDGVIWSNDKKLKDQNKIKIYNTNELKMM